jgi:hypothetical protein
VFRQLVLGAGSWLERGSEIAGLSSRGQDDVQRGRRPAPADRPCWLAYRLLDQVRTFQHGRATDDQTLILAGIK